MEEENVSKYKKYIIAVVAIDVASLLFSWALSIISLVLVHKARNIDINNKKMRRETALLEIITLSIVGFDSVVRKAYQNGTPLFDAYMYSFLIFTIVILVAYLIYTIIDDNKHLKANKPVNNDELYCSRCGNKVKSNDIFCSKCGTKFED